MIHTTLASAAFFLLSSAAISAVNAGELDVPGYDIMNKARVAASQSQQQQQYKRAPSRTYGLVKNWQGDDFLWGWDFFNWPDPTHGMVNFQDRQSSQDKGLAYTTDSGSFILKVDNSNWLADGQYRDSTRITSREKFKQGQLLIFDAAHAPTGCSTWPAFWTVGPDWPYGGEIDIFEATHTASLNQMTLHTRPGCEISQQNKGAGKVLHTSCDAFYNDNVGCGVQDTSTKTAGRGFNKIGGGVFATLWNEDGISVWFFARNNIPQDITNRNPQPNRWGKPRALFSSDDCAINEFFSDQTIVINTTLCGDWAGNTHSQVGCPGTCAQTVANPRNMDQAYWEINYVRLYGAVSMSRSNTKSDL